MRGRLLAASAIVVGMIFLVKLGAGCQSGTCDDPCGDTTIRCGPSNECPAGYACDLASLYCRFKVDAPPPDAKP